MKHISVVSSCYNEEGNVREIYERVKKVMAAFPDYTFEYIFIDNNSKDGTRAVLRQMAAEDKKVKLIFNTRNFGQIRSPIYGMLQGQGDAVISLVSDLQEPPELIAEFIRKWEEGYKIAIGVKSHSEESGLLFSLRKLYYNLVASMSEVELNKNFTGFGLYDQEVIKTLRKIDDPLPYFRGLICDLGYERAEIEYPQARRKWGFTKNNFYTLYDYAWLGITNHSKVPLRLATMMGFLTAMISLVVAFGYLAYKLVYWDRFSLGMAPLVIGFFFLGSMQLICIGIVGEYIGTIHTQVLKRPMVIEKERINF
ncbi:MAG TPA: glycosyltransferase [Elusimicrobia bacterium]|nr:MAG: dolichol monophosphate mannose synthase [Elusimicrobia bacterium GWF2_62_30]HBA61364.1 glycosyltransferase [Elusimicrobiota bacterium]